MARAKPRAFVSVGRAWGLALALPLALSLFGAASCYSPSFDAVLYRCGSGNTCPSSLSCIDGFCVVETIPACKNGGIVPPDSSFAVCPGDNNGCGSGFVLCPADVTSPLCGTLSSLDMAMSMGSDLGAGDLGGTGPKPALCALCCRASR